MYEHKTEPLAPLRLFCIRFVYNLIFAFSVLFACLLIGIFGYHYTAGFSWIDSVHNASMILSGMGPVVEITTNSGKWFSSFYAIFSGVVFITNIGIILAPAIHRIFHKLHLEED